MEKPTLTLNCFHPVYAIMRKGMKAYPLSISATEMVIVNIRFLTTYSLLLYLKIANTKWKVLEKKR